jgi:hypothetical protein
MSDITPATSTMNALQTQIDSHFFPPCSTPYNRHESLLSAYQNCSSHCIIHSTAASLQIQTMALITSRYAPAHISPKGPGDARPTALQVIKDEGLLDGLSGKTVLLDFPLKCTPHPNARLPKKSPPLFKHPQNSQRRRYAEGSGRNRKL